MLESSKTSQDVKKKYQLAVVFGRFQLPTTAHATLFAKAAEVADRVLVIKGSSFQPRTIKNPFTFREIARVILDHFGSELPGTRISVEPSTDNPYSDDSWLKQVQEIIASNSEDSEKICVVGHKKDASSFYLDLFPQYDYVEVEERTIVLDRNPFRIDSTLLRNIFYRHPESLIENMDWPVLNRMRPFLKYFLKTPEYKRLVEQDQFIMNYKKEWGEGPFNTVDALVVKAGHILLIKRLEDPGKDLWALPGGFLEKNERIFDGAIRELNEETSINLPPGLIKGSFVKSQVFDHVDRSLRGRIITHAHLFKLDGHDNKTYLPHVKAESDAKEVKWVPIRDVTKMSEVMFEDHLSMIITMLGLEQ